MAYAVLCVRFTCFVHSADLILEKKKSGKYFDPQNSATGATLDTGCGLGFTGRGLSPRKMHQALLGALTAYSYACLIFWRESYELGCVTN